MTEGKTSHVYVPSCSLGEGGIFPLGRSLLLAPRGPRRGGGRGGGCGGASLVLVLAVVLKVTGSASGDKMSLHFSLIKN